MRSLLFIYWDGPQVSYLEGLFFPVLKGLKKEYCIHVIQFTWGEQGKSASLKALFDGEGMAYTRLTVARKPVVAMGTAWTLLRGAVFLRKYMRRHGIDIVVPRATFPGWMISGMRGRRRRGKMTGKGKVLFDMDGFPLEERVDFAGMDPKGFPFRYLKEVQRSVIKAADAVLVRTERAVGILTGEGYPRDKFHVVINGRDPSFFRPLSPVERGEARQELGIGKEEMVLVYCGSLGPQYCVAEMLSLFQMLLDRGIPARFLVLTGSPEFFDSLNPAPALRDRMIVRNAAFGVVPRYLGAADAALAIRKQTFSMSAVAPVKLGEYLMCGLPVLSSKGIGDTEQQLENQPSCFLLPDHSVDSLRQGVAWLEKGIGDENLRESARSAGLAGFSLAAGILSYKRAIISI